MDVKFVSLFRRSCLPFILLSILIANLSLSGCASNIEEEFTEKEYYDKAKIALSGRNFAEAARYLEALELRYPFGNYAEQAQLDLIYAKYHNLDLEGARIASERFIRLHPQNPNVDYAHYVKGISAYHADIGLAAQYFPMVDVSSRDPGEMRQAFNDFNELITRFPDSEYAADAQQRMIEIRNRLAAYELHAARYYIKREAFVAAANRAQEVVEHYPETPSVEEALMIMVECYRFLKLNEHANDALVVLAANYPNSKAFDRNMNFVPSIIKRQNRNLLNVVTFGLLD